MSDDSFIREVEEELRSDRMKRIWDRFGPILIGAAILIVIATAGYRGYQYYTDSRASASGDRFLVALNLANDGKPDEALAALEELEGDGYGAYPVLARMRAATVLQEKGDSAGAVAAFDAVAADSSAPAAVRDMAKIRAAYILVDTGSAADVAERAESLSSDENPLRHAAREALGLAAWKEGRLGDAKVLFQQIVDDPSAPRNAQQRAGIMLDLITASGEVSEG
ncbi:tetratricopeptide repeat protein [Oricola sp.]|uniref:tetratricopeptide repeat protein n=1 Tax=Oricola sp. TaxID=1979950 RepID=UPI0025CD0AE7|nr:tetratricopeptide repeat protein [Oricola sp.]MCI5076652.1 tetratricopeptide repeat protein [Oricola sp.]